MDNEILSDWSDWDIDRKELPVIIFGGNRASYDDEFDSRNKFVRLIDCRDLPPVFKIESLDGKFKIDRCFPLRYRLATPREVELLTNPDANI